MSDLFDEFRFFLLDRKDVGLDSQDVIYGNIANEYSLIMFDVPESDTTGLQEPPKPINLLDLMYQDDVAKEAKRNQEKAEKRNESRLQRARSFSPSNVLRRPTGSYAFKHPLSGKNSSALKQMIKSKKEAYNILYMHYEQMVKEAKGHLIALPLSISIPVSSYLSRDLTIEQNIDECTRYLNKNFSALINVLKSRSPYSHCVGYAKVILLRKLEAKIYTVMPFLHVIFYIKNKGVNLWYVNDIAKEWSRLTEEAVNVDYYSFSGELSAPSPEPESDAKQESSSGYIPEYKISYKDVCLPFPWLTVSRRIKPENRSLDQLKIISDAVEVSSKSKINKQKESYQKMKKVIKDREKISDSTSAHKAYLLKVAKQYDKIPKLRTIDTSSFSYKGSKKNK